MKKIIIVILVVFAVSYLSSCCEQKTEPSFVNNKLIPTLGVAILDSTGKVVDYDWTKVQTTGNFSILPTGVVSYLNIGSNIVYQSIDEVAKIRQILSAFEETFNVQVLSTSPIVLAKEGLDVSKRHIILNVVHQPKDTITLAILETVTTLVEVNKKLKRDLRLQSKEINHLQKTIEENSPVINE